MDEEERTGARACDFETLFDPISECPPFLNEGQTIRLLYEEGNRFAYRNLNVVDKVSFRCTSFQYHGPLTEEHFMGVDALMLLTSLNLPMPDSRRAQLYHQHFRPRSCFARVLARQTKLLGGRWLGVHLRTRVRSAFGLPEWKLHEVVAATRRILGREQFDRVLVFSDSLQARSCFCRADFGTIPLHTLDWPTDNNAEGMFLDFLAMSKASFLLGSGASSFSFEASLFGGGVPCVELYFQRRFPA